MTSLPDIAEEMRKDRDANRLAAVETYQARLPERALELAAIHAHFAESLRASAPEGAESSLEQASRSVIGLDTLTDPDRRRHTIQGEIARGGMGVVYAARDEILRRDLAVKKVISDTVTGSEGGASTATPVERLPMLVRRLMEEAQVTAQLDHSGVVPVHEMGVDDEGHLYFTMKRVRGRTLEEVFGLVREGHRGWSLSRALQTFLKICETLAYAHGKGVIHRDLKPANIMVGTYGEVFVMDWGLAKVKGDPTPKPRPRDPEAAQGGAPRSIVITDQAELARLRDGLALTMHGDVLGTLGYMPPEQAQGDLDRLDERSDLWSLGAMLYELFAGHAPYCDGPDGRTPSRVFLRYSAGPPTPLATLAPDAPPELVSIIGRAMAMDPTARFASAKELASELHAYLEGRVVRSHRTGVWIELRKWVARNRLATASIVAGALLVAGGISAFVWQQRRAAVRIGHERDVAEAARASADGLRLATLSELEQERNPARALNLALAAARLVPGTATHDALLGALRYHRLGDHLAGHEGYVTHGEFAGRDLLVTGGSAGLVVVWDLATGKARHWLDTSRGELTALALDPSQRRAAVGHVDGSVVIWDIERGEPLTTVTAGPEPGAPAVALLWTARDEVAAARAGGRVTLYDTATGQPKADLLPDVPSGRMGLRFIQPHAGSPDLLLLDPAGGLHRLDAAQQTVRWSRPSAGRKEDDRGPRSYLGLDPGARDAVVGRWGAEVELVSFADGSIRQSLRGVEDSDLPCLLAPDGQRFVCVVRVEDDLGRRHERLQQYERSSAEGLFELRGVTPWTEEERPLAFSPDGELLIAGSSHDARALYAADGREAFRLFGHQYALNKAVFSADGSLIATLNNDRVVRTWRAVLPGEMRGLVRHQRDGWRVVLRTADCTKALLFKGRDDDPQQLAWMDATSGDVLWSASGPGARIRDALLVPAGDRLMLFLSDGRLLTLDARDGTRLGELRLAEPGPGDQEMGGATSPDGSRIVVMLNPPRVQDTRTGAVLCELATGTLRAVRPVWSPDSRRIVMTHGPHGTLGIYDAGSGALSHELVGHAGHTLHGIWLAGGGVATTARDASVRTFDASTGEQVGMTGGLPMRGNTIDASHDGRLLAFLSDDIYLLDATTAPAMAIVATLPRDGALTWLRFDPHAPRFFTEDAAGGLRTWLLDPVAQASALKARSYSDLPAGVAPRDTEAASADTTRDPIAAYAAALESTGEGRFSEALQLLDQAEAIRPRWARLAHARARVHALAGREDAALAALEEAFLRGWFQLIGSSRLRDDPAFVTLRNHERFVALLETHEPQ